VALVIWVADSVGRMRTRARAVVASVDAVEWGAEATIVNRADLPAYDVVMERDDGQAEPFRLPILYPGAKVHIEAAEDFLAPGYANDRRQSLTFTIDGRRWRLHSSGKLRRHWWWEK